MAGWIVALLVAACVAAWVPSSRMAVPGVAARGVTSPRRIVPVWRRRRAQQADREAVLEVCDLLAAELAAGRPAHLALAAAGERWPPLRPVVELAHLGADVPEALRSLSRSRAGASDLGWVAAAWQVAHGSGHGLASALERTSRGLRARRRTRRLVDSELASARATARLVACLPLAVLLMGSGAGSDPWAFLLTTPVGWCCLAGGTSLLVLGLWWIERLADRVSAP